jgi:predicted alpha/beta hydrolase family esterase
MVSEVKMPMIHRRMVGAILAFMPNCNDELSYDTSDVIQLRVAQFILRSKLGIQMGEKRIGKVLVVPGIGNSGPTHWQSLWEANKPNFKRVQQRDWDNPVCGEWVAVLDAAIVEAGADTVVVAHSLGCLAVAAWAARTRRALSGALLVAVPNPNGPQFPSEAKGFATSLIAPLPFRSIVVASSNDPYGTVEFASECASAWGSRFVEAGELGHINAASGIGSWPAGLTLMGQLMAPTPVNPVDS